MANRRRETSGEEREGASRGGEKPPRLRVISGQRRVSVVPRVGRQANEDMQQDDAVVALVEQHVRRLLSNIGGIKVITAWSGVSPVLRLEPDLNPSGEVLDVVADIKRTIEIVFGSSSLVVQKNGDFLTLSKAQDEMTGLEYGRVSPKTPKVRSLDSGERFIYAGETPQTVDYLGRLDIDKIGCFEHVHPWRNDIHVSSKKVPTGEGTEAEPVLQTMAIFSRYPVAVDGWDRGDLRHYKMKTLNLCDLFGIPHTQADLIRARENGRHGYKVLVKGFGHFAVVLPRGDENSLNLAPLSAYPAGVFCALNAKINQFLKEHPDYVKVIDGTRDGAHNGIPQFGDDDLAMLLGEIDRK